VAPDPSFAERDSATDYCSDTSQYIPNSGPKLVETSRLPQEDSVAWYSLSPGLRWRQVQQIAADLACATFSVTLLTYLNILYSPTTRNQKNIAPSLSLLLLIGGLTVLCSALAGVYTFERERAVAHATRLASAQAFGLFLVMQFVVISGLEKFRLAGLAFAGAITFTSCLAWRCYYWQVAYSPTRRPRNARRVLIIGAGPGGEAIAAALRSDPVREYEILGFLDDKVSTPNVLGTLSALSRIVTAGFADEVILSVANRELISDVVAKCREARVDVRVLCTTEVSGFIPHVHMMAGYPVLTILKQRNNDWQLSVKRMIDVTFAGAALVVLSPLWLLIAVMIKLDSPGPVLHRSSRIGRKGRRFTFYKFRTMVANAEEMKAALLRHNERTGLLFKIADDPRITRVGRLLRKYSIDEFPQFYNVLVGDMSLVGPRPPSEDEFCYYKLEHLTRLTVETGITGLWQVTARQDPSFERTLALDLEYITQWSLALDFWIFLKTISSVFRGTGS
jgi:exopolysaccharide biosynthesis polyprenyl glycosylphosphotransferase